MVLMALIQNVWGSDLSDIEKVVNALVALGESCADTSESFCKEAILVRFCVLQAKE